MADTASYNSSIIDSDIRTKLGKVEEAVVEEEALRLVLLADFANEFCSEPYSDTFESVPDHVKPVSAGNTTSGRTKRSPRPSTAPVARTPVRLLCSSPKMPDSPSTRVLDAWRTEKPLEKATPLMNLGMKFEGKYILTKLYLVPPRPLDSSSTTGGDGQVQRSSRVSGATGGVLLVTAFDRHGQPFAKFKVPRLRSEQLLRAINQPSVCSRKPQQQQQLQVPVAAMLKRAIRVHTAARQVPNHINYVSPPRALQSQPSPRSRAAELYPHLLPTAETTIYATQRDSEAEQQGSGKSRACTHSPTSVGARTGAAGAAWVGALRGAEGGDAISGHAKLRSQIELEPPRPLLQWRETPPWRHS
jgi:hypothetical protein